MLTIRISPVDYRPPGPSTKDVYTFRFEYCLGGHEFKVEKVFCTGEPDSAFDAMFEVARRQIREALPALRMANPTLFTMAMREAARIIENSLNLGPGPIMVKKP